MNGGDPPCTVHLLWQVSLWRWLSHDQISKFTLYDHAIFFLLTWGLHFHTLRWLRRETGRIAQRESIGLTHRGSQVQTLFRPPDIGVVVKSVITPACQAGGRGFKSRPPRKIQSLESQITSGSGLCCFCSTHIYFIPQILVMVRCSKGMRLGNAIKWTECSHHM